MAVGADLNGAAFAAVVAMGEVHGFGGGGGLIEQARVGNRQAGEIDHGLEGGKRLKSTLGNFRLIGGVLGIPAGIF